MPNKSDNNTDQNSDQFAEQLRGYWEATKISQRELAGLIEADPTALNRWMLGKTVPEEKFLYLLLNEFIKRGVLTDQTQAEQLWKLAAAKSQTRGYATEFKPARLSPKARAGLEFEITPDRSRLKQLSHAISQRQAGDLFARFKQEREFYLPRQELKQAFEDFLASDKNDFSFIGEIWRG